MLERLSKVIITIKPDGQKAPYIEAALNENSNGILRHDGFREIYQSFISAVAIEETISL